MAIKNLTRSNAHSFRCGALGARIEAMGDDAIDHVFSLIELLEERRLGVALEALVLGAINKIAN